MRPVGFRILGVHLAVLHGSLCTDILVVVVVVIIIIIIIIVRIVATAALERRMASGRSTRKGKITC